MKIIIALLTLTLNITSLNANSELDKILAEGKLLRNLEKASWISTDHFLENYQHLAENVSGYTSYIDSIGNINTMFFNKDEPRTVLVNYNFGEKPSPDFIIADTIPKKASKYQKDLIEIRENAHQDIYTSEDEFYKVYQDTGFNLIPVILNNEKSVFILTGSKVSGSVIIGNDYKLEFDVNNKLLNRKKLHSSLLDFPYQSEKGNIETWHSHSITEFITSTDVCTLLLYKEYLSWDKHYVIGNKFVTILNLSTEELYSLPKELWDNGTNDE
ncbi:MAG: hypothetical protein Kapaf2KO_02010 [Candidatus Kapaibacteriales bacterium]